MCATGQVRRALPYIAPEAAAAGARAAGRSADLFSLGVVLLQLLTGSAPAGLAQHVQSVLAGGSADVARLVDPCVGACAQEDAAELCRLALRWAGAGGCAYAAWHVLLPCVDQGTGTVHACCADGLRVWRR